MPRLPRASETIYPFWYYNIWPHVNIYSVTIFIIVTSVLSRFYKRWQARKEHAAVAAAHGCEEPFEIKSRWPLSVNFVYYVMKANREHRSLPYFVSLFQEFGKTFVTVGSLGREVSTIEPENIDAVLNTKFNDYWFGPSRVDSFMPFFGSGIFTQDGPAWKHSRALLRPQFMHNRTSYFTHIQEQALRMMGLLEGQSNKSSLLEIDLEPVLFRYTLDTTTSMLFGQPISERKDQAAVEAFVESFGIGQAEVLLRFRVGLLSGLFPKKALRQATKTCHDFVDTIVAEAREKQRNAKGEKEIPEGKGNLLDNLLQDYPEDDLAVRSQLINILLAGRDTTACLLTWTFRLLASHPKAQQRLYKEIAEVSDPSDFDRQDLHSSKMPYLNAVLKETLRLYPSVPANQRVALVDTYLPRGGGPDGTRPVLIRKGDMVNYLTYAMHRRKDIWGEDANCFRPERWLENDGAIEKQNALAYIPFNAGPRVCLGQDMAMLQAAAGVVHIMKTWNGSIKLVGDAQLTETGETGQEKQVSDIMVRPLDGCRLVLSKA